MSKKEIDGIFRLLYLLHLENLTTVAALCCENEEEREELRARWEKAWDVSLRGETNEDNA